MPPLVHQHDLAARQGARGRKELPATTGEAMEDHDGRLTPGHDDVADISTIIRAQDMPCLIHPAILRNQSAVFRRNPGSDAVHHRLRLRQRAVRNLGVVRDTSGYCQVSWGTRSVPAWNFGEESLFLGRATLRYFARSGDVDSPEQLQNWGMDVR